ncbi:NAD-dependent epimerase/dehydratase family protein (plasmid) [Streptomyces viridifaciens]|nr:NAD-dependent epimerase/dehydratase family protein [Streptomyces viridifaciens]
MSITLITGGAGFIGGHLARALTAAGTAVRAVDDLRVTPLIKPDNGLLRKRVLDLTSDDLRGVDVVYHLASEKNVPLSFEMPLKYLENLTSTEHLLRLCVEANVRRVVVASTCEVYGRARRLPTAESEPLAPLSPYAASKVAMEMVSHIYQRATELGGRISVVRLFNVFGPGERPDAVVPRFCAGALADSRLPIEGDGTQRRDFSYIDDVVDRLRHIPLVKSVPFLNIGSGRSFSVLEIADILKEISPMTTVTHSSERPNEIPEFRADTTLLDRLLPLDRSMTEFREGMIKTLEWWSSNSAALSDAMWTLPTSQEGLQDLLQPTQ